jgi:hypothetical protein
MGSYIVVCQTLFIFLMWLVWGFFSVKHVEIIYSDHPVGLKNGDFSYNRYFIYKIFFKSLIVLIMEAL